MDLYAPLNPELYAKLQKLYGKVGVVNQGVAMTSSRRRGMDGKLHHTVDDSGEYYKVNCPYCNDTTQRLYINHMYNIVDEVTKEHPWRHMAICYNDTECMSEVALRQDLWSKINRYKIRGNLVKAKVASQMDSGAMQKAPPPGITFPIHELPKDHPAVVYLTERGHNVEHLGRVLKVAYCAESDPRFTVATNRIVIPIHMHGELVGWQCRYIGDLDDWRGIAKYYGMPKMPKRRILYNYDVARNYNFVVIHEGATDVWNTGPASVAILGSAMANLQRDLIISTWREGAVVVMLDGGYVKEGEAIYNALHGSIRQGVVLVELPEGHDPGDTPHAEVWRIIRQSAEEQKVELQWRR